VVILICTKDLAADTNNVHQAWAAVHSLADQHQAATHKADILVTFTKDILLLVQAERRDISLDTVVVMAARAFV
jgi:hypothetical protein